MQKHLPLRENRASAETWGAHHETGATQGPTNQGTRVIRGIRVRRGTRMVRGIG